MVYFGNMHPGTVMIDAKPIPGTNKVVAIFSPGHGRARARRADLTIVEPGGRPGQAGIGVSARQPGRPTTAIPGPFREDCFMAAAAAARAMDGTADRGDSTAARAEPRRAMGATSRVPWCRGRASRSFPIACRPDAVHRQAACWPTSTRAATWPA